LPDAANLGSEADTQIQILKSRSVVGEVVDERHLQIVQKPKYFPLIGETIAARASADSDAAANQTVVAADAGSWLGNYAWGAAHINVTALVVPDALKGKPFTLRALGTGQYVLYGPEGEQLLQGRVGQPASATLPDGQGQIKLFVQELATV